MGGPTWGGRRGTARGGGRGQREQGTGRPSVHLRPHLVCPVEFTSAPTTRRAPVGWDFFHGGLPFSSLFSGSLTRCPVMELGQGASHTGRRHPPASEPSRPRRACRTLSGSPAGNSRGCQGHKEQGSTKSCRGGAWHTKRTRMDDSGACGCRRAGPGSQFGRGTRAVRGGRGRGARRLSANFTALLHICNYLRRRRTGRTSSCPPDLQTANTFWASDE